MSQNGVSENIDALAIKLKEMVEKGQEKELIDRLTKELQWKLMYVKAMQSADARNNGFYSQRLIDLIDAELKKKGYGRS